MPKIEVHEKLFHKFLGKKLNHTELIDVLEAAKAELDEVNKEDGILKIELNDTNRPDLWSTLGLARQLKVYLGGKPSQFDFYSTPEAQKEVDDRVIFVDMGLQHIRPFIAAFVAEGPAIDEALLIDLIQSQEKLCGNYGSKRKTIAMGIYRSEKLEYPIHYIAADPLSTKFIPLGLEKECNLNEILTLHPKGMEYAYIVKEYKKYPFLKDNKGDVLSFPPIINSAKIGAVEVGDSKVFVELTGTDMYTLVLAASIAACDFADAGFKIKPVKVCYPYETPLGSEIITPFYFQKPIMLDIQEANKLLGETLSPAEAAKYIEKMGNKVTVEKEKITLFPPVYRNDFMHPVDIVEEIMMGRGIASFTPVMAEDFTMGRLTEEEEFSRKVRDIMIGLGFQEMIYNYLGSKRDFIEKMKMVEDSIIEIANPMTESYEMVRNSIIPNLLASEAISGNAVYPHLIFEAGKVVLKAKDENYGSKTKNYLSFLFSDREADFNDISAKVSALFYYLCKDYTLQDVDDPRFIKGRCATVFYRDKSVGVMGEVHPDILENWGIGMPCTTAEIDLDQIMK
ncbi:MAG: phenylalanine--tRNA ligase subunit beta [Spirochaetales bacterium]|nr:phenylalanine--tRNA ligase subunit beta [Spirochaetales bacterium]